MPTSVNVNGKTIYVPGIYAYVDASALAGKSISTGNVALVGNFPTFEKNALNYFTSPQALRNWDPSDLNLARLSKLLFSPASDDAVTGANQVVLVNAGTGTQAQFTFKDAALLDSIVVKSKKWGIKGNQTYFQMSPVVGDAKLLNIDIAQAGASESYTNVGSGDLAQFDLNTTICTEMSNASSTSTVSVKNDVAKSKLEWAFKSRLCNNLGVAVDVPAPGPATSVVWSNMVVTGKVTVAPTLAAAVGGTIRIVVTGKNAAGLAQVSDNMDFVPVDGTTPKIVQFGGVDAVWTEITSVALSSLVAVTPATNVEVAGLAFDLTLSSFNKVSDLVTAINNYAAKGWIGTSLLPLTGQVPADQLDKIATANVLGASVATVRADIWAIVQALSISGLVAVTKATNAVNAPAPWNQVGVTVAQNLLGGTETSPNSTDYENAFKELETANVQWVVPMSTNIAMLKAARQHCINSALVGRERGAFGAAPYGTSLANLLSQYTAQLNSRHIALCAQQIQITGPTGAAEWLDPEYMAVQLAAMKAGTSVAEPLTNKKPDVLDFRGSWTAQRDDNEVIQKAILAYTNGTLGVKVLRSVTTWLTDDNPAYCEVSANESINTNIRSIRANLESSIGTKANIPLAVFKAKIETLLAQQVTDGIIYAWRNVVIQKIADKYRIDYDVAPIFPFNFAEIWAHVGDFEF